MQKMVGYEKTTGIIKPNENSIERMVMLNKYIGHLPKLDGTRRNQCFCGE